MSAYSGLDYSPPSSPACDPPDSSPASSPNLRSLSTPPPSPGVTHPFAASTKANKRPRLYEKRESAWASQIDSPDVSFDGPHSPVTRSDASTTVKYASDDDDFFSDEDDAPASQSFPAWLAGGDVRLRDQKVWDNAITRAIDSANGVINLSQGPGIFQGVLTSIPPSIADLADLVVLSTSARDSSALMPLSPPSAKRVLSRAITAPAGSLSPTFLSRASQSLVKSPSFHHSPVYTQHGEIQLHLANHSIKQLPCELFWIQHLTILDLERNALTILPPQIDALVNLETLNVSFNKLQYIPAELLGMRLRVLKLMGNPWLKPPPATRPSKASNADISTDMGTDTHVGGTRRPLSTMMTHFAIPSLTEFCLRAWLAPVILPSSPAPQFSRIARKARVETVLEARFELPLPRAWTDEMPAEVRETLRVCVPRAVARDEAGKDGVDGGRRGGSPSPSKKARVGYNVEGGGAGRGSGRSFARSLSTTHVTPGLGTGAAMGTSGVRPRVGYWPAEREGDAEAREGRGTCPSPLHARPSAFVKYAEERMSWEEVVGCARVEGRVPVRWRGCMRGCLGFLEGWSAEEGGRAEEAEGGDTDVEDEAGVQAVQLGGGLGLEFD